MELNKVAPDNPGLMHWKTVSRPSETEVACEADNKNEFHYVHFNANAKDRKQKRKRTKSTGVQSNLELQKEKVVPFAKIIAANKDDRATQTIYVTTAEFGPILPPRLRREQAMPSEATPRHLQVQMSEQTQTIIHAIRNELKKFNTLSLRQHLEETASNCSEA